MIRKLLLSLLGVLIVSYLLLFTLAIEPEERRPGLKLAGTVVDTPVPSFEGRKKILLETRTWYGLRHSVTTTSWFFDGALHVPCGGCDDGKVWAKHVARNPNVRLKIDGQLYARVAHRLSGDVVNQALSVSGRGLPAGVAVFRMHEH